MPDRSPELHAIFELARAVATGPARVEETLARICDGVRATFGFDRAIVARYDPRRRTVRGAVLHGLDWPGDDWLAVERFPFLERALETRRAVLVGPQQVEGDMPHTIAQRFGVRSVAAAPLMIEDRCLGFIVGDRAFEELELGEGELQLLTALGWLAAVFVDRADHYTKLQQANDDLQRLDQAKSAFVSLASHELRTPIAVVHGITATLHLRGAELSSEQLLELRSTLYEQTSRLSGLAEQLLDLSRIDADAVCLRPQRFRPRECLDALLPRIAPDRLTDVRIEVEPELEIEADPDALERVLSNLLLNALRHGRPPVSVRSSLNGQLHLIVEDRGDGVDPSFVPRLFDRFTRSESARGKVRGGAGLGLAIALSFAEALGGRLTYERVVPAGARFTLELPRAARSGQLAGAVAYR